MHTGAYMPWDAEIGAYGHEVGHGFGFEHSYSNDPTYRNAEWSGIGEYSCGLHGKSFL